MNTINIPTSTSNGSYKLSKVVRVAEPKKSMFRDTYRKCIEGWAKRIKGENGHGRT